MSTYKRHRFPPDIISYAVWLYYRFNLSHRDIEDLRAERGITVTREAIRLWYPKHSLRSWGRLCIKFGAIYTRRLKRKHRGFGDTFYIDEVFAGVPDHSNQWQAALPVAGSGPGWWARAAVSNLLNLGRHLVRAEHYRNLRLSTFTEWERAVAWVDVPGYGRFKHLTCQNPCFTWAVKCSVKPE